LVDLTFAVGARIDSLSATSLERAFMNTPQLNSIMTVSAVAVSAVAVSASASGPYTGPERRVADRRAATSAISHRSGSPQSGPYFPERRRSVYRATPTHVARVADYSAPVAGASSVLELPSITAYLEDAAADETAIGASVATSIAVADLAETRDETGGTDWTVATDVNGDSDRGSESPVSFSWLFAEQLGASVTPVAATPAPTLVVRPDSTPVVTSADPMSGVAPDAPARDAEHVAQPAAVQTHAPTPADGIRVASLTPTEGYPFAGAGGSLREIARTLRGHADATEDAAARTDGHGDDHGFVTGLAAAPLPMWGDDDMPDTIVAHEASLTDALDHPVDREELFPVVDVPSSQSELAASALESVAHKVRVGSLELSRFRAELGEAAAVATVLAALLSAHD